MKLNLLIKHSLFSQMQGHWKQSLDGQASLMLVVKLLIIRAAKIWALVFLAVRRHSHSTSAKFSHTDVSLMHVHLGTYLPNFTTAI